MAPAAVRRLAGRVRASAAPVAPDPLPLDRARPHPPIEAYWKIEAPTLAELWPRRDGSRRGRGRGRALQAWGELLRRVHRVRPRGHRALPAAERQPGSLETGTPTPGSAGVQADQLATTRRRDGAPQVTYDGHPLYYYVKGRRRAPPAGA